MSCIIYVTSGMAEEKILVSLLPFGDVRGIFPHVTSVMLEEKFLVWLLPFSDVR